jgi:hypothetical protein
LIGGSLAIVDHVRRLEVRVVVYSGFPGYVSGPGTVDGAGALQIGTAKSSQVEAVCAAESVCDTAVIFVSSETYRSGIVSLNLPESICVAAITEARANASVLGAATTCTIRRDECPWVTLNLGLSGNDGLRHDFLGKSNLLR